MNFIYLDKMQERLDRAFENNSDDYFDALLIYGEALTKLIVLGLCAGVKNDRDRQQYRLLYTLARADGLGTWVDAIEAVTAGVPKQKLSDLFTDEIVSLTRGASGDDWQYDACAKMRDALLLVSPKTEPLPRKTKLKQWFADFVAFRNKTRGHGAIKSVTKEECTALLRDSIQLIVVQFPLFGRQWAALRPTLNRKYRVARLSASSERFAELATVSGRSFKLEEGVYLSLGDSESNSRHFWQVPLLKWDFDGDDMFFPNGAYRRSNIEFISYVSGITRDIEVRDYLDPVDPLPPSETEGRQQLEGTSTLSNIPSLNVNYVARTDPEARLTSELTDDNQHPSVPQWMKQLRLPSLV